MKHSGLDDYFGAIGQMLNSLHREQQENLLAFASTWTEAIENDRLLFAFGSGHAGFIAGELYWRAGGLAPVVLIEDPARGASERTEGYAETFVEHYDIKPGDLLVVVSNSGINAVPIEVAMYGRREGAKVVALTSLVHSAAVPVRHTSGKRLMDLADIVIDTGIPPGDAIVPIAGNLRAGSASTVLGAAALSAVVAQVATNLATRGLSDPPVLVSANVPDGDNHNRQLAERYWQRLASFPRRGKF